MMTTIKREKFIAIQAKGGDVENGKDVVDVVIDDVVETANSIANKIKLSSRTIQRDLTRLKDLNVIKHEGPDNGGEWVISLICYN